MEDVTDQGESSHVGGEQGQPDPETSTTSDVQQTSFDAKAVLAALEVSPEFEDYVDRKVQGVKDRRFNKIEGQLDDFESQLGTLKELRKEGWTEEQAIRLMKLEQPNAPEPQQQPGKQPVVQTSPELDGFFQEFDVDPSGPEATQLIRESKTDSVSLARFAIDLEKRQSAPPNPASIMPAGSGDSVVTDDINEVHRQLVAAQKAVPKDWGKIRELNAKFQALSIQT
jgi:hypothetical protein